MPAKSKKQQRFFGMARGIQKGKVPASDAGKDVQRVAQNADPSDVEDFASTKHNDLPNTVKSSPAVDKLREYLRGKVQEAIFERRFIKGITEAGPRLGSSGNFKSLVRGLAAREGIDVTDEDFAGMLEARIGNSKSLAAFVGRKKFGKKAHADRM